MTLKSLLLVMLVFSSGLTFSQENKKTDKIDKELSDCLKKPGNGTTVGMCNCTWEALDKWDKKLNTTYKTLQTKVDSTAKGKLVDAQREWVKFKEKEIALINATYGTKEGTMWQIVIAEKVLGITRQRALELEDMLSALTEEY